MKIKDASGDRTLEIDGSSNPETVFIMGEFGYCIEVGRESLLLAIAVEVGVLEPVSVGADRYLTQLETA